MALLPIERREHCLHVRDDRLDLDDQKRPGRLVPGEDVERAALRTHAERDLGNAFPSGLTQKPEEELDELCMAGVEESVGRLAVPIESDAESCLQRLGDSLERVQPKPPRAASFHASDQRLRDPDTLGEIELAPTAPHAQGTQDPADAHAIHSRSIATAAYPAVTWPFGALV